jgi:hypothetical protein
MEYVYHSYSYQRNPLDIKQLAEFDATIAQFTQTEQRRRRLIYLRDAAQQVRMGKSILKGFGWLLVPFAIIPIFWPFFVFVWIRRKKAGSMMETQLKNALEYWDIHEVEIDKYVNDESFESDNLIPGL